MQRCGAIRGIAILLFACAFNAGAQTGRSLLPPGQVIDWSQAGVGAIPTRSQVCAHLAPPATLEQINAALAACPAEQAVELAEGRYEIPGTLHVPAHVTLRGAGADRTILNATGRGRAYVIAMGGGNVAYAPVRVTGGAQAGSTRLQLAASAGIQAGQFLIIAEKNNPLYVSSHGSEGVCHWCDGGWSKDSDYARGQIVAVTAVDGNAVRIAPALYAEYTEEPFAVPFRMSATHAGVEDLQVYANQSGYDASFGMSACAYCWIKGVEANFTDGDYAEVRWGFHDEIRDSYFTGAFVHEPGLHDADVHLFLKTTASLVENNIFERAHRDVEVDGGAAGNVIAYNFMTAEFDSGEPRFVLGGVFFHGAHPQFNLLEGNVMPQVQQDATWGSSSHTTLFRNWLQGTNRVCTPVNARVAVECERPQWAFQAARAVEMSYLSTRNSAVGNLLGSEPMQSLMGYHHRLKQQAFIEYPALRSYDDVAYAWSFGYGRMSDDGQGTGCSGGQPPCHRAHTADSSYLHGNYVNSTAETDWLPGVSRLLPASLYLAARPQWWGTLPFPAIGPEVRGGSGPGGHSFGNPAQDCYRRLLAEAGLKPDGIHFRAAFCMGQ